MNITSAATGPRSISGCARIAATTLAPPSSRGSWANACSAAVEREREGRHAAAVDRDRHLVEARRRPRRRPRRGSPPATDASRAGSRGSRGRARGRRRGSPRACPSSCAGSATARHRSRGRPRSPARQRGARAPRRAAPAAPGARRRRSRARGRGCPGRARTSGSACSGFADERRNVSERGISRPRPRSARRAPRRRERVCSASTTSPRVTSTWIGSAMCRNTT